MNSKIQVVYFSLFFLANKLYTCFGGKLVHCLYTVIFKTVISFTLDKEDI